MVADNPNFPPPPAPPPRPGAKASNELAQLRAEVERLTEYVLKAQQHALEMGNRALELAAQEVRLRAEIEQLRGSRGVSRLFEPGQFVIASSEDEIRAAYGPCQIELCTVIECHPPVAEYKIWPLGYDAWRDLVSPSSSLRISAGDHLHPVEEGMHNHPLMKPVNQGTS